MNSKPNILFLMVDHRILLTQRVYWEDQWKYVFNGFDEDEHYDLVSDPSERPNRINDPSCQEMARQLLRGLWQRVTETGDTSLTGIDYPPLRIATLEPKAI